MMAEPLTAGVPALRGDPAISSFAREGISLVAGGDGTYKEHVPKEAWITRMQRIEAEQRFACPMTTKSGEPCKGKKTETGYCVGHNGGVAKAVSALCTIGYR